MAWIEAQEFCKPIDREAASIAHQRQWDEAGHSDKAGSRVAFNDREMKLGEVVTYQAICEVLIKGKKAKQWVAEAQTPGKT
jgi:hypothetical protein